MAKLEEIPTLREWERIGSHSHIKGLGIKDGKVERIGGGLVGQIAARQAAAVVVDLVKKGKFAGRAILMAGPMGTGKTAIALAIAKELGRDVPFVQIFGSEIYSSEIKKTEFLMRALRRATGVRIHEMRTIYEGEVTHLDFDMVPHPYNPYQKVPRSATIKLRTKGEEKQFKVDSTFAQALIQNNITVHDVVQIDAETGRIACLGKSADWKPDESERVDLTTQQLVEVPKGKVQKEKEFVYMLTLHDLDMARARRGGGFVSLFFGGGREEELTEEDRAAVDEEVKSMVQSGTAEIIPGVLFIDETHMLDIEAFSFLNRAIESELAPIIIFATNRGIATIRGTDQKSPHGIPMDLLDRMLIINTYPYEKDEVAEIIRLRCKEEKAVLSDRALQHLVETGYKRSPRYATQLLAPAAAIAAARNATEIDIDDIKLAEQLFVDIDKSVEHVKKFEKEFVS
ncbi:MAG: RuvB-like domain-containing protein [Candidatus Micrarchaeia archaeon]